MNLKNMLKRLTSNYSKDKDSNVYKLFSMISVETETLKETFEKIRSWQGIDNAEGTTLDLIGEDVIEKRKGRSDEEYRPMLKFRMSVNRGNADINGVNTAINSITGGKLIAIEDSHKGEPASVLVRLVEYDINTPYEKIDKILAAGVRVYMRAEKTIGDELHLASATLTGEEVAIRPYMTTTLDMNSSIYARIGVVGADEIVIYPKGYTNRFKKYLDTGLYLDDDNIMDSGY